MIVFAKASGDINHPRLLKPLAPTPLDGQPMAVDSTDNRRAHFAKWLTAPENPFFARAIVNRVFANFMGRGLVDPVDDLRATNPASNEELFAALAKDFRFVRLVRMDGELHTVQALGKILGGEQLTQTMVVAEGIEAGADHSGTIVHADFDLAAIRS